MGRDYACRPAPGDTTPCPECGAAGGPGGEVRVRSVMTDREYNDKRCNKCGHKWTIGDSLELPFKAQNTPVTPAKAETGTGVPDYDFGDGWKPDPGSSVPF